MRFPVAVPTWRMLNDCADLGFSAGLQAQQGYRLGGDAVVVDSQEHWQAWDFPLGTVKISVTGEVSPTRWRRHVDATPDIVGNLRLHPPGHLSGVEPEDIALIDAIQAGSNRAEVVNLFDDDMTTFWEPGPLSGRKTANLSSRWWFIVDLGRIVLAEKIVLRFADEDLGDPFKLFEVLTSDGQKPFAAVQGRNLEFSRVYRSLHPNRDERLIEIDSSTGLRSSADSLSQKPCRPAGSYLYRKRTARRATSRWRTPTDPLRSVCLPARATLLVLFGMRFGILLHAFDVILRFRTRQRPLEASMRIDCSLLVPLSWAETLRMPLASMSKVTSIWGMQPFGRSASISTNRPRGAAGMPSR